jgi:hypothetical protein
MASRETIKTTLSKIHMLFIPHIMISDLQQATNNMHTVGHLHIHNYSKAGKLLQILNLTFLSSGTISNNFFNFCEWLKHTFCEQYR